MSQRAWETAMGMRGYAGSAAEREDRMSGNTNRAWRADLKHTDALGRNAPRVMAGNQLIAFVHDAHHAHLIAAAPTLLAALYEALPYVETAEHDEGYKKGAVAKVVANMRVAIQLAEPDHD